MSRRTTLVLVGVAACAAAVLWLLSNVRTPPPVPTPLNPTAVPAAPRADAAVRFAEPTPTAEPPVTGRATVVLPWEAAPKPSPTEPEPTEPPTPRPQPTATPAVQECVAIAWSSGTSPTAIGQVLVEVRAVNRCGRELPALDVWFQVAGFRHGDLVQATRGHLFDPLPKDGEGKAMIVLPGSADWYDDISVAVLPLMGR